MGAFDDLIPGGGAKPTAAQDKARLGWQNKVTRAQSAARQLGRIEELYNKNFKGVGPGSLLEYLPTQQRRQFDAAANSMRPLLKPLVRDPGEGAFTDSDQALLDSLIPDGARQDSDNEERIKGIRALINDLQGQYQQQYGAPKTPVRAAPRKAPRVIDFNSLPE